MASRDTTRLIRQGLKAGNTLRLVARLADVDYHVVRKERLRMVAAGELQPRGKGQRTRDDAIAKPVEKAEEVIIKGQIRAPRTPKAKLPEKGIKRYILTCAQNNTKVFDAAWDNLQALAKHYNAELLISRFSYDKAVNGGQKQKPGTDETGDDGQWFDERILPFVNDGRLQLAPGLVWCGELNILPTAARPLSALEAYTGRDSSIIPHVKIAMASVASGKFEATKFMYTTGAVTQRNYIQRKAGQKAEFHHCYGGLLVEVTPDGEWWCRQLNADSQGVIYDLNVVAKDGGTSENVSVLGVSWGDIHEDQKDPENAEACWGDGGVTQVLKPRYQFFHDILSFHRRNHHDRGNPHLAFEKWVTSKESVQEEVRNVERFLTDIADHCVSQLVVVDSNHDNAMEKWLREADYKTDPVNAVYFLEAQLAKYKAIENRDRNFHLLEWAIDAENIKFLRQDQSFVIAKSHSGGIECGMHGHLGANGARGGANGFAKMGRKANVGHSHSAGIHDGIYTAGTSSDLDLRYNSGPSSWSHSHIVTYPNGKRAIITIWKGRWRA